MVASVRPFKSQFKRHLINKTVSTRFSDYISLSIKSTDSTQTHIPALPLSAIEHWTTHLTFLCLFPHF